MKKTEKPKTYAVTGKVVVQIAVIVPADSPSEAKAIVLAEMGLEAGPSCDVNLIACVSHSGGK